MKNYEWILFDADETLFHFDAFHGLQRMFSRFDIQFSEQHYKEYEAINLPLWGELQKGKITADQLKEKRFYSWACQLNKCPKELNKLFMLAMSEICKPIDGAIELLNHLKPQCKLGIITNGFTELQQSRLERHGLHNHFDLLVVSEQIGVAKPNVKIFEYALTKMSDPEPHKVLMVGDTLETDILGGRNAGFDTCWLNRMKKPLLAEHVKPHYTVASLAELQELLTTAELVS